MKSVTIQLNTINDVKQFVNIVSKCDYDVDLISGRYAVDAKYYGYLQPGHLQAD